MKEDDLNKRFKRLLNTFGNKTVLIIITRRNVVSHIENQKSIFSLPAGQDSPQNSAGLIKVIF